MMESRMRAMAGNRRLAWVLASLPGLGLMLSLSGCNKAATGGFVMPPPVVTTTAVEVADVPVYLDEIGKTVATEVVNVIPQVSGQIVDGPPHTFVDGSDVHVGQLLFTIDKRPYEAAVASAEAALEQNEAQLDLARKNYERMVTLMPSKAVAQQDFDTSKNAVDVAAANKKASDAALDTAKLNLQYCTINSPIDGRAGQRLVDVGNVVTANSPTAVGTASLLSIQKIAPIYVDFTVTETDLPGVRDSMAIALKDPDAGKQFLAVEVENPDGQGKPLLGKLTFLDNSVQDGTGTIKLRATVENSERILWPGQFVRVRLVLKVQHDALLVPTEAIQVGQTGSYIFTLGADGTAVQKQVTVGQRQGGMVVVQTGLEASDRVVTTGQLMLMPGVKPVIVPAAGASPATAPSTQPAAATASVEGK